MDTITPDTDTQAHEREATLAPGPEAAPASSAESRSERAHRQRRRARLYVWAVLLVALLAALVVLTSRNTRVVKIDWVFGSTNASLAWIVLAAAVLGWLLGITTAAAVRHRTRRPS